MRQVEVSIEKLANGGAGFGRCDGKALFVPFTAPGDVARVQILLEKSSYAEGKLIELIQPSAHRVTSPCPIFAICGGCNWQHMDYGTQLREKRQIFAELLWRAARVSPECVQQIMPAQNEYGYRSRIQVKVCCTNGIIGLGFYLPKTHEVIDLPETCVITHEDINKSLGILRQLLQACPDKEKISQVDIARGDDGQTCAIFRYSGASLQALSEYILQQSKSSFFTNAIFVRQHGKIISILDSNNGLLSYTIPENTIPGLRELTISFSKGGFSQVNYAQNLTLLTMVATFAELTGKEKILDLYCGNGNFSIPLAVFASHVTGLEEFSPSIEDAKRNAAANGVANVTFNCCDAVLQVKKLIERGENFDIVVLDPPRQGAADVAHLIHALNPQKIIYVSCDPATLARDLGILKKYDYQVLQSQGVDMFPQTYHLESVTLLTKN